MASRTKNLTSGSPGRLITGLAIPLMLGNICQQLYTVTDTAVVGKFVGVEALAALGNADWLGWLMLGSVQGLSQGFGIVFSSRFGAEDHKGLHRAFRSALWLGAFLAVLLTTLSQTMLVPVLHLIKTPDNVFGGAVTYLRIYYGGMIVAMAYNIFSVTLNSLGNSRIPFTAMLIASSINISLDLLFVVVFKWGIGGAAIATVIAQFTAASICLFTLIKIGLFRKTEENSLPDWQDIAGLLSKGAPLALQNMLIAFGGVIVQSFVNSFGYLFIAGYTATNKMYGILEMASISFGNAMCAYTGQNRGAQKFGRIRSGLRFTLKIILVISLLVTGILVLFGRTLLGIFIEEGPDFEKVLSVAYRYLLFMCIPLVILYTMQCFRFTVQGLGNTWIPMVSSFLQLLTRLSCAVFLTKLVGSDGVFWAEPLAWISAIFMLIPAYFIIIKRFERTQKKVET